MLDKVRAMFRLLILGPPRTTGAHDQLDAARAKLGAETDALERDLRMMTQRRDPIDTIVHNIKRASGK